ncbi:hypothetical protein HK104_005224 [Borealophlyctis nickersoniae]|nr:hypothetical protein HK104_005224 [Borealophlyctis nickersoniae]
MGSVCSSFSKDEPRPSSVASSHQFDEGRRFHAKYDPSANPGEAVYTLPNDDTEMDRLNLQVNSMCGKSAHYANFLAPVTSALQQPGAKVLDAGCGSGIWAMEVATDSPKAEVIGIDLSQVQPTTIKPVNLTFEEADVTEPLPFPDGTFDLVRCRFLVLGLKADQWEPFIREMVRVTKVGGYVEISEPNIGHFLDGMSPSHREIMKHAYPVLQAKGIDLLVHENIPKHLSSIPTLHPLKQVMREMPVRAHPTDKNLDRVASLAREDVISGTGGLKPLLMTLQKMTAEEYDELIAKAAEELKSQDRGLGIYVWYAQKKQT